MEDSNRTKARTVYGQFDRQTGSTPDCTDPCRVLVDVCTGKHGTAENELLKTGRLTQCSFLGFIISPKRIRCLESKLATFKHTIRDITSRSWGISVQDRLERLRMYINLKGKMGLLP